MAAGDSVQAVLNRSKEVLEKAKAKFPSAPQPPPPAPAPVHEYSSAPYSLVHKARAAISGAISAPKQLMKEAEDTGKGIKARADMAKGAFEQ